MSARGSRRSQGLQVSTSAPTEVEEHPLAGLTPGVMILLGAASMALWILWILLCLALAYAWEAVEPAFQVIP